MPQRLSYPKCDNAPMTINSADLSVAESNGWFRWLHDRFAGRYALRGRFPEDAQTVDWEAIDGSALALHCWEVGLNGRLDLLENCWGRLNPGQRGMALAGVSENEDYWDWISARLPGCGLNAAAACELACNAVLHEKNDHLSTILNHPCDLRGEVGRYDGPGRPSGRFSETIQHLSCRCVDLVLEAALIRRNTCAIRLALEHGADANIPIWILERSYNERHCALSYCLSNGMDRAAEML